MDEGVQGSPSSPRLTPRPPFGWLGPGVIMATSGIGASDIVSSSQAEFRC